MPKERWNDRAGAFNPVSAPDYLPRAQLRELQSQRLRAMVARAWHNVALFRERMQARGLTPDAIGSIDDIAALPFTVKADLRDTYPFGLFASPMDEVVRLHASSGTTGKPIVVAYTQDDLDVWTEAMARTFAACGLHRGDIVQNAFGYGLFTGGMGTHYGAEALGATVIPVSGGNTDRQVMLMRDFGVTAVCATPSFFVHLVEKAGEMGVDLKALDIYGLSEVAGPGVANECLEQRGLHVFEDHFYPEIIDPETGEPLPDGAKGELVFTCLTKEGVPLIRYRTRDITRILDEGPCPCGRTSRKIARLMGRTDDMLIIRGINVFPSQVEDVLVRIEGVHPQYLIVVDRQGNLDTMEIKVEVTESLFTDQVRGLEALRDKIHHQIKTMLNVSAKITLVEPKTIERTLGKAKRVQDLRKLT